MSLLKIVSGKRSKAVSIESNNWGRWGVDDERGALNLIDSAKILSSLRSVEKGEVISLAQPTGPGRGAPPHRNPVSRFMDRDAGDYALGARAPGGFKFAEDSIALPTHSGTHIDALSHTWSGDALYNNFPASNIRSTKGAVKLGAEKIGSIVTRGVLLDFVKLFGGPLSASQAISAADLKRAYEDLGLSPQPGDAVLIRTGWWKTMGGTKEYFDLEPGISEDGAIYLANCEASLVGSDNYAVEVQPDPDDKVFPVHLTLLHQFGIPLVENLDLEELAQSNVNTFLFILLPLRLEGSTASPATPIAII
jgi:kynurenine formamidase